MSVYPDYMLFGGRRGNNTLFRDATKMRYIWSQKLSHPSCYRQDLSSRSAGQRLEAEVFPSLPSVGGRRKVCYYADLVWIAEKEMREVEALYKKAKLEQT